jgi:AmmeMemoRadiSam system protein A
MDPYITLAKSAIETFVKEGKAIDLPEGLPKEFFTKQSGVFVSIYKALPGGERKRTLRGCIGTYLPTKKNLAEEIISNAISASQDPRFLPLQIEELPYLSYEVYILDKPEPVKSLSELDPKKYGILVKSSYKSGLLLPDLEGVDTPEKQVLIACQKAGIDPTKESIIIYKFEAIKHSENVNQKK